jgi:WD40 repeat protein
MYKKILSLHINKSSDLSGIIEPLDRHITSLSAYDSLLIYGASSGSGGVLVESDEPWRLDKAQGPISCVDTNSNHPTIIAAAGKLESRIRLWRHTKNWLHYQGKLDCVVRPDYAYRKDEQYHFTTLAFSDSGKLLMGAYSSDRTVRIWDVEKRGMPKYTFDLPGERVLTVCSANDKLFYAGTNAGAVSLFNADESSVEKIHSEVIERGTVFRNITRIRMNEGNLYISGGTAISGFLTCLDTHSEHSIKWRLHFSSKISDFAISDKEIVFMSDLAMNRMPLETTTISPILRGEGDIGAFSLSPSGIIYAAPDSKSKLLSLSLK